MDFPSLIAKQNRFSLRIAKHIGLNNAQDSNLVFSPISVHLILNLIAAGSKGKTLEQILSLISSESKEELKLLSAQIIDLILSDGSSGGGPCLVFVSGVWIEKSLNLKSSFESVLVGDFKAESNQGDFRNEPVEVTKAVNTWVESKTNGLIKMLIPSDSVDNLTSLILANALYFKGAWDQKFSQSETRMFEFYRTDGTSIQVPFMTSDKKQYVSAFNEFKVLKLPYHQGADRRHYSMYIFLPNEANGIQNLLEILDSDPEFLERHIPPQKVKVKNFRIPRFKIPYGIEVSAVLKRLGLTFPFSSEADLSEMIDSPIGHGLYVSSIFHKAFIEVNEEGTEAAAASGAVIGLRSMQIKSIDFVADHPFLFLIREDVTGVVMFFGHVLDPSLTT